MTCFQNQRGLTLLETIIVLMIAALIISGIWIAYASANLNDRVTRTVSVFDKTLQVARDYVMSQSVQSTLLTLPTGNIALSSALYNQGMMPSELSYKGQIPNVTSGISGANSGTQIFTSPLGYDFFIQNSGVPEVVNSYRFYDLFEIHVGFAASPSGPYTAQKACLQLIPKLIGTQSMINDRGIIGWSYGSAPPSGLTNSTNSTVVPPTPAQQETSCAAASDAVFYFRFRQ